MSERLQLLVDEVSKLPDEKRDRFIDRMLEELEDDRRWAEKFAATPHVLERLAEEARAEHAAGLTRPLEELFD